MHAILVFFELCFFMKIYDQQFSFLELFIFQFLKLVCSYKIILDKESHLKYLLKLRCCSVLLMPFLHCHFITVFGIKKVYVQDTSRYHARPSHAPIYYCFWSKCVFSGHPQQVPCHTVFLLFASGVYVILIIVLLPNDIMCSEFLR